MKIIKQEKPFFYNSPYINDTFWVKRDKESKIELENYNRLFSKINSKIYKKIKQEYEIINDIIRV